MRAQAAVLAIVLALLSAGCLSEPTQSPSSRRAAGANNLQLSDDPNTVPHVHDGWENTTSRIIAESRQGGGSSGSSQDRRFPSWSPTQAVLTGTAEMRITTHFNQTGGEALTVLFDYKPPNQEWQSYEFENGVPFSIIIPPESVDPPHSGRSYWEFAFHFHFESEDGGSVSFNSYSVVEVLRMSGPLPKDPAHPEQWFGNVVANLLDLSGPLKDSAAPTAPSAPPRFVPSLQAPLKAVPWNTAKIEMVLFYNSSTPPALHYSPSLSFHGPDRGRFSYEFRDVPANETTTGSTGLYRWTWNIDERFWDSPYAEASLWELQFTWPGLLPTPICCFERPAEMDGDYHFLIQGWRG